MPPAARPLDIVVESHEDRIQRLEEKYPDLSSLVATVALQVKHTTDTVLESTAELGRQLDGLQVTMENHAKDSAGRMDRVVERIGVLETVNRDISKRWLLVKKLATPLALIGGALLAKFGESLFAWIAS